MTVSSAQDAPGRLVLIVEDVEDLRIVLRLVLERSGYRVLEAANGAGALAMLEQHGDDVALILTDLTMPGMDGAVAIRGMRHRCPSVPVIASSGVPLGGDEIADLGVVGFLSKPFSPGTLLAACDTAVDSRREENVSAAGG